MRRPGRLINGAVNRREHLFVGEIFEEFDSAALRLLFFDGFEFPHVGIIDEPHVARLQELSQRGHFLVQIFGRPWRALFQVAIDYGHPALAVLFGSADHAVRRLTRPADDEQPGADLSGLRVEDLISLVAGIIGVGVRVLEIFRARAWQTERFVYAVADGEDHGVALDVVKLACALGRERFATFHEFGVLYAQRAQFPVFVTNDFSRGAQESEEHPRRAFALLRFRVDVLGQVLVILLEVFADDFQLRADALKLLAQRGRVNVGGDGLNFDVGVGALGGAAPRDRNHLFDLLLMYQPMSHVHHHVAHADDRHALADIEIAPPEFGQSVEVIDQVFGVVDALNRVARNAEGFRALRAAGHDDG